MSWKIPLIENFQELKESKWKIKWKVYADNALPKESKISFGEIDIVDLRRKKA